MPLTPTSRVVVAYQNLTDQWKEAQKETSRLHGFLCLEMLREYNTGMTYTSISEKIGGGYTRRDVADMCHLAEAMIAAGHWSL